MGNADLPLCACYYSRMQKDVGSTNYRIGHRLAHAGLLNFRLHGPVGLIWRSVKEI